MSNTIQSPPLATEYPTPSRIADPSTTASSTIASITSSWTQESSSFLSSPSQLARSINVTQSGIPSTAENIGSLCNSAVFIVALSALMGILLSFYIRARHEMKFKQKILFFLTSVLVGVEIIALVLRVVYNSTAVYMNGYLWRNFPNVMDYLIVEWVFSVLENASAFFAIVNISVITGFLQDMFLTTATAAGTITKKYYTLLRWSLFSINMICSGLMVILNAVMNLLARMTLLSSSVVFTVQITLLLIYLILSLMNLSFFSIVSIRLLLYVRKISQNVSSAVMGTIMSSSRERERTKFMTRPFTKICGLMLGMLLSSFLQIVSAIVSFFTSNYANYLHILDYLLQALGVLVFAVFVLLLYIPLWNDRSEKDARNYVLRRKTSGQSIALSEYPTVVMNETTTNEKVMIEVTNNEENERRNELMKEDVSSPAIPSLQPQHEVQDIGISVEKV